MKRRRPPPRTYRLDAAQLDRIAEDLIPVARALVDAVHHGTQTDVATILGWLTQPVQRVGLTVVLAAMIDPAADPEQLLAWLRHPRRDPDVRAELNRARLESALNDAAHTRPRPAPTTARTLPEKGAA